ncbi:S8 family serine peptidase [bacterium]|nr:S8 family serine peptidase [bacterium]
MRMTRIFVLTLLLGLSSLAAQEQVIPDDPCWKYQISYFNEGDSVQIDRVSWKKSPEMLRPDARFHMHIASAWALSTGSKEIVVALLDDGFFYNHEDLRDNIWRNPGETGFDEAGYAKNTNGIDDDGNGYIDDVMGWDFVFDDPDPDCYIFDGKDMTRIAPYWHATPTMGIIGAAGNNGIGVAGINWHVSMMLLKIAAQGTTGDQRLERTVRAIRYAVDNGARIINWSGYVRISDDRGVRDLREAVDYAESKGVLLIAAAGNSKKDLDLEENRFYPVCLPNDNIIAVAESDFQGRLYVVPPGSKYIGGSNYGKTTVDIAAIAENYTAFQRQNLPVYSLGGGTSCAAPAVTGVAALILSVNPALTGIQVKEILLKSATKSGRLAGKILCGGVVNARAALDIATQYRTESPD